MAEDGTRSGGRAGDQRRPERYVRSLERGVAVIRAFDADHPHMTLTEVSQRAGLSRASTRRLLLTLADLGLVCPAGRLFSLTPRILELGYAYLSSQGLPEVARPHLERLVAEVEESSSVSVLDGDEVVYVARVATSRIMKVSVNVGTRLPAYATSMGRVMLAELPAQELDAYLVRTELRPRTSRAIDREADLRAALDTARRQGYAIVDQELEEGLRSVAAPIRANGRASAAVNISAHASRTSVAEIRSRFVPQLLETAKRIEEDRARTRP